MLRISFYDKLGRRFAGTMDLMFPPQKGMVFRFGDQDYIISEETMHTEHHPGRRPDWTIMVFVEKYDIDEFTHMGKDEPEE